MEAGRKVKEEGGSNDLLDRIRKDSSFTSVIEDLDSILDPSNFIGRCPEQVTEFLSEYIDPLLDDNKHLLERSDAEVSKIGI